jgi:hypothetical protein
MHSGIHGALFCSIRPGTGPVYRLAGGSTVRPTGAGSVQHRVVQKMMMQQAMKFCSRKGRN